MTLDEINAMQRTGAERKQRAQYHGKSREFKPYERAYVGMHVVCHFGAGLDAFRYGIITNIFKDRLGTACTIVDNNGESFDMFKSYLRIPTA